MGLPIEELVTISIGTPKAADETWVEGEGEGEGEGVGVGEGGGWWWWWWWWWG